jgi:hypothetical protein
MLRIVQSGNAIPFSFIVDPSAEFEPGQIAQLTTSGNQIVCGVSDGLVPLGVIDDFKTRAFTGSAWNETIIVPATGVSSGGKLVTAIDIKMELENPNVISGSFTSTVTVTLNSRNGVITFPAGTELNFDMTGSGTPDAIRTYVSYRYQIPNIIGDDSTAGSGRVTVWFQRFIGETDMFETNQTYPLNCNLFVSEIGLLTSRQPTEKHPAVAICIGPPSPTFGTLQLCWL